MNSRESSIRTCQLGPNRWNQSPRAWACVSCVSEDVLPASDPHLYGFSRTLTLAPKGGRLRQFNHAGNGLPYFGADRRREEERAGMGPRETSSP
jgi:hypothetical protein